MSRCLKWYVLNWYTSPQITFQLGQSALSVTHFWAIDSYRKWEKVTNFTLETWEHHSQYMTETAVSQKENGMSSKEEWSAFLYVFWSFGLPFYGVLVRPTQIWFHLAWQSQAPLLTAGFIWCGRPVLGFSADFNIWSQLWPEEGRILVDDWWLWADRKGNRGVGWKTANRWRTVKQQGEIQIARKIAQVNDTKTECEAEEWTKEI